MPEVEVPEDTTKLKQQIEALAYQIKQDKKQIQIHNAAYRKLLGEYVKRTKKE